jgi:hydrogenase expression/formation protein HypC
MCLAIPSKIVEKSHLTAVVDVCGARRQVNLMLLPEEVEVGDYVLVHAGFAMQKIDTTAAEQSLQFFGGLVNAEKNKDSAAAGDGEMAEILERGTISWDKSPRREPEGET